jgi:predicted dehydrogenase
MKILVLGSRGFGKVHLDSWRKLNVDIALYDRNEKLLKETAEAYGAKETYSDIPEALSSDADIVDIILPHNMHREVAISAISRKKHVLIEKPIATSVADAEFMIEQASRAGVKFMVAEQYYFDASVRYAAGAISEGKIGRVHTIIVRDQRLYSKDGWRTKASIMGGGSLIDGGIHFVDTLLNFGGEYRNIRQAVYHGSSSIEGEDTSISLFDFRSSAHGLLFYTWSYPHSPRVPSYEVIGSEGSIVEDSGTHPEVDFKYMSGIRYAFGKPVLNGKTVDIRMEDVFDREIGGFLKAVEEDSAVPMDPEIAKRDLAAVMEIYRTGMPAMSQ